MNDAAINMWADPPATAPQVSLVDYCKNLVTIIEKIQCFGSRVILMTPNAIRWTPELVKLYGTAMIAYFSWYVCTAGSDQMAIQRYLSTRDKLAARRAFLVSLTCDALVNIFLGLLGLALMMYFTRNAQLLPDGLSVAQAADRLFPRFIVIGLPVGITELVIAGLMAAAMSSLSFGVNSSCLVVCKDFIERFHKQNLSQRQQVARERWISLVIGVVVVLLSLLVGYIKGNLLEVTYKTVNLLVAPLFVPFFMALFIKRASPSGVLLGTLCSVVVAVLISFSNEFFFV